jgi:hypothetical protein
VPNTIRKSGALSRPAFYQSNPKKRLRSFAEIHCQTAVLQETVSSELQIIVINQNQGRFFTIQSKGLPISAQAPYTGLCLSICWVAFQQTFI